MRRNLALFIIISLILHLTSFEGLRFIPESWYKTVKSPELTQVEIIDNRPAKKNQNQTRPIIKQLDPKEVIDSNKPARFESEKTQRVKTETKASVNGLTANASSQSKTNKPEQKAQPKSDNGDLPEFARYTTTSTSRSQVSQLSYELPDVMAAGATNLNTDASTFYSFYSRVEELFYVRWVERLNYYWDRLPLEFKRDNLAGRSWRTQITVLLTAQGVYDSSVIEKASGYQPFDEAVTYAFKNAHYFPNVPKAKVEPDGFVRLRYSFQVNIGTYR